MKTMTADDQQQLETLLAEMRQVLKGERGENVLDMLRSVATVAERLAELAKQTYRVS